MSTFLFLLEQCFSFCPADKFNEVLKLLVLFMYENWAGSFVFYEYRTLYFGVLFEVLRIF